MHNRLILFLLLCLVIVSCGGHQGLAPLRNLSVVPENQKLVTSGRYQVRKSDSLYSIAFRFGIDFQILANINQIKMPYTIYPGQVLLLRKINQPTSQKRYPDKKTIAVKNKKDSNKASTSKNNNAAKQQIAESRKNKEDRGNAVVQKESSFDGNKKVTTWLWPVKNKSLKKVISGRNGQKSISIKGSLKEPVRATAPGRVVYSGNGLVGYGNLIIIKHNQNYLSAYAHNERNMVKEKQVVKAGQKIATMGKDDTGLVRLHFEIRYRGRPVSPLKYLRSSG